MNKRVMMAVVIANLAMFLMAQQTPAFPEAEGWGKYATGGRAIDECGSKVYYVTRLDDCSDSDLIEGTLRWAIRTGDATPRTILFRVCGTIKLTTKLKFAYPNVTIAGQSAPGGGICISGANIYVCQNNVIIRYVRFRAGDEADSNYSALDVENCKHIMIDHCSFSWSMEENVTMYDNDSTTMQWCILSEPLYYSRHKKGQRGYGSQWGGEHSSYHHNLFAHCVSRGPRLNGARDGSKNFGAHDQFMDTEIVNNVMYNWGNKGSVYGGECTVPDTLYVLKNITDSAGNVVKDTISVHTGTYVHNNLVNNYYKPGPATDACAGGYRYFANISNTNQKGTWYVNGNYMEPNEYHYANASQTSVDKFGGDYTSINTDNWYNAATSNGNKGLNLSAGGTEANVAIYRTDSCGLSNLITLDNAQIAYQQVIKNAGCRLPWLDEVDTRILAEAAGTIKPVYYGSYKPTYLGVIDSQNDLKPADADSTWSAWPTLAMVEGETLPTDTDLDGMPDEYETTNGLNKDDSSDGAAITESGYSNLEIYLNSIKDSNINNSTPQILADSKWTCTVNKTQDILYFSANTIIKEAYLYALNGQKRANWSVNTLSGAVSITNYEKGIYLFQVVFIDGFTQIKKIVL